MVLATDLDGTFLDGDEEKKKILYHLIHQQSSIRLIFVTGRGLENVLKVLYDKSVPRPDYIISDVGAKVFEGSTLAPVQPLQKEISSKWKGSMPVIEALKGVSGLEYQEVPQRGRCSFYVKHEYTVDVVKDRLKHMDCDVIYSAGRFLDVLPKGVNKGTTLNKLIQLLGYPPEDLLIAGDSLNDLSMYQYGYNSVVTGNAEIGLINEAIRLPKVYLAKSDGAGGILEALHHYKLIPL